MYIFLKPHNGLIDSEKQQFVNKLTLGNYISFNRLLSIKQGGDRTKNPMSNTECDKIPKIYPIFYSSVETTRTII